MRAVTRSENFDLNAEIERITAPLGQQGFVIPSDTLVKVLAVTMGQDPTPESMLELRSASSRNLHEGVKRSESALQKAITFLIEELEYSLL